MAGKRLVTILLALAFLGSAFTDSASAARLKDITNIQGVRDNQLIGYGLVVGLLKTGDDQKILFTIQSLASMLSRMGVKINAGELRPRNVAAVVVTANLPPFSTVGSRLDVQVASIGNAKSLVGGTLLMTPLKGADGRVYAMAQGQIITGGYSFGGESGTGVTKNHPTVGSIPNGSIIEREVRYAINDRADIILTLMRQDFTTAVNMAETINDYLEGPYAMARDGGSVKLRVPGEYQSRVVTLIAKIEGLEVETDRRAKVVLNERTGTVVMGSDVRLSTIAISHGSLKIKINNQYNVSQPGPFSSGGKTTVTPSSDISAVEEKSRMAVVKGAVTIGDVVMSLNSIGVSPRDLINILQALKAAGALEAEMEVI